ncbi:hypothetical protein CLTHE_27630 [Clostridium thermobutyricum DSM 4928]|uniref:DUF218 domain-containing protein n=1 Tax=Clostridium thermobutyricum DSM 4928 TaxID=1121339 RepID=A0A1V4SRQ2_9CLOT|nr:hypothetical protein CLTHE_27630 [Clostridium thermobutyricum DSM 4928]
MVRNSYIIFLAFGVFIVFLIFFIIIPIRLVKKGKKENKKKFEILGYILGLITCIFLISYVLFEGFYIYKMDTYKTLNNVGNYNYEIILGGGLNGYKPGPLLQKRLDLGIDYLEEHPKTKVILSGGKGANEVIPESEAMENYLISNGISKDRIIQENKSKNTAQNIEFSKRILDKLGAGNEKILIVTNDFHLYRAQLIADTLGMKNAGIACCSNTSLRLEYTALAYPSTIKSLLEVEWYKNHNKNYK